MIKLQKTLYFCTRLVKGNVILFKSTGNSRITHLNKRFKNCSKIKFNTGFSKMQSLYKKIYISRHFCGMKYQRRTICYKRLTCNKLVNFFVYESQNRSEARYLFVWFVICMACPYILCKYVR